MEFIEYPSVEKLNEMDAPESPKAPVGRIPRTRFVDANCCVAFDVEERPVEEAKFLNAPVVFVHPRSVEFVDV
jgi:hypothetical protein